MSRLITISAIAACYFVFAILLNSVGTVILQSLNSFGISKPEASSLEAFKDLTIAAVSFLTASLIPRIGYKIALMVALVAVTIMCLLTPMIADFMVIKLLFACIGAAFALVKVSVYTIIGRLCHSTSAHASLLNTIEGIFMLGSLSGYWLFSLYAQNDAGQSTDWLNVYYPIGAMILVALVLVALSPIEKEPPSDNKTTVLKDFTDMISMSYQPLVLVFIICVFLYVLIEQGIGTWLPTFNNHVLQLPVAISVQLTSIFAAALALGRLLAGQILRFVHWYVLLNICIVLMAVLILLTLPLTTGLPTTDITSLFDAPMAAFLLPLVGLMMAPIYPVLNSVMLSNIDKRQHAPMTGLIVVFSALGGTTGSVITGWVFELFGGQQAFYLSLVPMAIILCALYGFRRISQKQTLANQTVEGAL